MIASSTDAAPTRPKPQLFSAIFLMFVVSGAAGLIDQLCFAKYLGYIVGSTAYAVSTVLAAFMTGLALGAHWGGRFSRHIRNPILAYGVLELIVAATVALTPFAFDALTPLYVDLVNQLPNSLGLVSVVRWLLAMLVVVIPTTAMGMTLPLLSRLVEESGLAAEQRERRLAVLYAANTLGGASGALLAAYLILPILGLSSTLWTAAALSAAVGAVACLVGRRAPLLGGAQAGPAAPVLTPATHAEVSPETHAQPRLMLLVLLALFSGWFVFAAEVVSTHLLALIIGNSAYAFGLILATFLLCLFFGAILAPRVHRRFGRSALPGGLALAAMAIALTLPVWDLLPLGFAGAGQLLTSFESRELLRAVIAFAILVVPVTLMGLTFPLVLQNVARYPDVGTWVGRLTAVNTVGAVLGSLATGYLMLPAFGSQGSLRVLVFAYAAAALLSLNHCVMRTRRIVVFAAMASALLALLVPRWNLIRLTSGMNVYFEGHDDPQEIVMMREDVHGGVTTVTRREDGVLTLLTNGKFQGNTGWEMKAQRFFAHYPSLFVSDFDSALVIGLGTGTTLGTLAAYPWEKIDVVEISPAISEAAREHFTSVNVGALDDPRVELHHQDGRNYLLTTNERYDLISMELSSIWFAGAANLYSDEYYALVDKHLRDTGVFQQWVQLHHIRERDFATVLATLRRHFEHVALFYGGGQGILVASKRPLETSHEHLTQLQARPQIARLVPEGRPLADLIDDVLVTGAGLNSYLANVARDHGLEPEDLVSNDDNLYLEYATPRGNVLPWSAREQLVQRLRSHRDPEAVERMVQ